MATATRTRDRITYGEFKAQVSRRNLGMNLPQQLGRRLWLPMFLMGLMAFPAAFILAAIRGSLIAGGAATTSDASTIAVRGQLVPAVQFIGFMGILSAITFAIARILGAFREGGGSVQESTGRRVLTLVMPYTARAMLALMMMVMMLLLFTIVTHFVLATVVGDAVLDGDAATVQSVTS